MATESYSKEQLKLLADAQRLMRTIGLEFEHQVDIQDEILAGNIRNNAEMQKAVAVTRQHAKETRELVKLERARESALEDYSKILADTLKPLEKIGKMSAKSLQDEKARIAEAVELEAITQDQADNLLKQLATLEKISKNPVIKTGFGVAADSLDSMQKSINTFASKIPGGEMLSKALGLDKLSEKLQNAIVGGARMGLIATVAIAGTLFAVLMSITKEAEKFSEATGLTYSQSRQIADVARETQTSFSIQLATQEDILAVQQESITAFGTTAMLSGQQAANLADLGKAFGYGAQQAGKVNNVFMTMGASATQAYEAQESLAAEALKAGVSVGAVTKDIADNAQNTAKYFGGNVTALKNAAIEAAKMGMSLSTMAKVSDKLLDIQSSIAAQFEFQALSGRQLDLDLARQLALEGDIAGASKEVLNAVGSTAEFNKMSVLEKKKLAEATGMEVSELQKSLVVQEKLGDLTDDQKAAMSGLNLSAQQLMDMGPEQIRQKLAEQQAIQQGVAAFDTMKNQLMTALIPLAETLGTIFSTLAPIIKAAFLPLEWAGKTIQFIVDLFSQFPIIMGSILALTTAIWVLENQKLIASTLNNAQYEIGFGLLVAQEAVETAILAIKNSQTVALLKNIGKSAIDGALAVGKAIGSIFSSFAMIPFGIGIPLAIAAVGGLVALSSKFLNVGDAALGADSTFVHSPTEGTLFPSKNDDIAIGPGVIGMAQAAGAAPPAPQSGGADNSGLFAMLLGKFDELIQIGKTPPTIQIGSKTIQEISNQQASSNSFRQNFNGT